MPNYCTNTLSVDNITDEQTKRILAAVENNTLLAEYLPEPDYTTTPVAKTFPSIGVQFAKTEEERSVALLNAPTISDSNWWDWRVQHWGTKWDVCEVTADTTDTGLCIFFNSAWSPPGTEWITAFGTANPDATISLTYSEPGCDFCGVTTYINGVVTDKTLSISTVKDAWVKRTQSAATQAILNNEDHDQYDDVNELVLEAWWEVEGEEIAKAIEYI